MQEMKTINVRGEVFKVGLVNNYCAMKYADEFLPSVLELGEWATGEKHRRRVEALRAAKTVKNSREAFRAIAEKIKAEEDERKALEKKICALRIELIQELLESNGHTFDPWFWEHRASTEDQNDFVLECLVPEFQETSKKKAQ